jgi:large repetitive protein
MTDYTGPDDPWCTTIKSTQRQLSITILPAAETGRQFTLTLTAADGTSGYRWTLATGSSLPTGLTLDSAASMISGRPIAPGVFATTLEAADSLGLTKTLGLTITVAPSLAIRSRALPTAKAHHAYHARLRTSGGVAPIGWTVARGSLPVGLRLNPRTGELAGKPSHRGTFRGTIQVSDRLGAVSKTTFVLKVVA